LWFGYCWICRGTLVRVRVRGVLICGLDTAGCVVVHWVEVQMVGALVCGLDPAGCVDVNYVEVQVGVL
jgi:hypothetical protein